MSQTIHEKIAALRKIRELTQEQLGAQLGITGQAVSKWEKGESLPDIMLLPRLCALLGTTADALLGIPVSQKKKAVIKDFTAYAKEAGPSALVEAFAALSGSRPHMEYGTSALVSGSGAGFAADPAGLRHCMAVDGECVGYAMRILENRGCRALLKHISPEEALTRAELGEKLGMDEDTVNRIVMGFMKRGIIVCGVDARGKRGYLPGGGMAAVCMVLAGSALLSDPYGAN